MFLVVEPNTIIDPWAVVVHTSDATLTRRTMMTLWYFYRITFYAAALEDGLKLSNLLRLQLIIINNLRRFRIIIWPLDFEFLLFVNFLLFFCGAEFYIMQSAQYLNISVQVVLSHVISYLAVLVDDVVVAVVLSFRFSIFGFLFSYLLNSRSKQPSHAPLHRSGQACAPATETVRVVI